MGKRDKEEPSDKFKQKNPRNKASKTVIVFDPAARVEYLTGFRKRKAERKKAAREREILELKEEKARIKKKRRDMSAGHYDTKTVPEVVHLVTETYDLPEHTVAVTDVSEVDLVGNSGLYLGLNPDVSDGEEPDKAAQDSDDSDSPKTEKKVLSKKELKHVGNEKKYKPESKRHKNISHLMNHKNKRVIGMLKRKNADKAISRKKKKPRNNPK